MRQKHRIQRALTEAWLDLPYAKELEVINDLLTSQPTICCLSESGASNGQQEYLVGCKISHPVRSLLPIPSIRDSDGSKDQRHLGEEYDQAENCDLGPAEYDDPDENCDRRVATRELDRQRLELAAIGSQRCSHDQTGASGDDREYNRPQDRHTEVFENGSSET